MKKPMFTKVLSLVLAFVLILGMLPVSAVAHAAEVTGLEPDVSSQILDADTTTTPEETEDAELIASASTDAPTEDTAATAEETEAPADTEAPKSTEAAPTETEATASTEAAPEENETTEVTEPKAPENGIVAKIAAAIAGPVTRAANTLSFWGSYIINGNTTITWASGDYRHGIGRMELGGVTAYCIQPGVITKEGFTYSGLTVDQTIQKLGSGTTGQNKYRAISLIMAYGWPNNSFPNNPNSCSVEYGRWDGTSGTWHDTEKYMATQMLIWEISLGYRSATPPYSRTNASLYNMFYKNDAGPGEWKTFQDTYNTIVNRMSQTTNKIPSFTSNFAGNARTYKLTYDPASGNYKTTLTDTNSALSAYTMPSISGVTFSKSGNTLTITATPAAALELQNGKLCTATGTNNPNVDSNVVRAFWGSGNRQAIVTPIGGRFDPTPAYFKLEAEAASTAKVVKKNSEAGGRIANFTFELRDSAGTVLDTKVTDANGNLAFSIALTVGATYVIHEVPANGFVVQLDQKFTAKEGDNVVTFVNTKVYGNVQVVKVDAETGDRLTGAVFQIYQDSNGDGVLDDVDLPSAATMKTDGENPGVYDFNHLPYGKYHLREVQAPEGYYLDDTVYNFEIVEDGETIIVESATGTGTIANKPMIPEIGTTATVDGSHKIYGTEIFTLKDVVAYKNLIPRKTYTVSGVLMDKATGEPLLIDGEEVISKTTFVPEESSGTVTVSFQFDSRKIKTETEIVVFESLLLNGKEVAVHANINDQGQTVKVTPPEIGTTAMVDGSHEICGTEIFTLEDVVAYKNLTPGKEYTLSGVLMDKATGSPLLIDGEKVTAETSFIPDESSGTVTVSFQFDSRKIKTETEIVVFESLERDGVEIAVHADLKDLGQTVIVHVPEIGTTATVDGSHVAYGADVLTLEDVVAYKNLTPGKEYVLQGVLMDKATGSPLLIDGEEVTSETTFTPETPDGEVTVSFVFDGRKIKTETEIVAFESLERDGVEIAVHADLEDGGQTVTVHVPEIGTTATVDGKKDVLAGETVTITDVVAYSNLTPGKEYAISGVLMDKSTGKPFLVNGVQITAETKFTPEQPDGEVEMTFTFESKGITKSTEIVVFESLERDGVEIAVHADLKDLGQTVTITPPVTPPKTGDNSNLVLWAGLLTLTLLALTGIAVFTLRKKN